MDTKNPTVEELFVQQYEECQAIQDILMEDLKILSLSKIHQDFHNLTSKQRNETVRSMLGIIASKERIALTLASLKEKQFEPDC